MKSTSDIIEAIINGIIEVEGEYSDHSSDLGGATRWGITEEVARKDGYLGDMRELPKERAFEIYRELYYYKPNIDLIGALSDTIMEEVMDTGVNCGVGTAIKMLQVALNVFNDSQSHYMDIVVDGLMGDATADALAMFLDLRGVEGENVMLKCLNCLQGARYVELCLAREKNEAFLYGWLRARVGI
jgi:lysozyme family protein